MSKLTSHVRWVIGILWMLAAGPVHGEQPPGEARPTVVVLATGGTIAGSGSAAGPSYRPGAISIAEVLQSVPGLNDVANIRSEQVANVGSGDIDEAIWRRLLDRVRAAIADPAVSGVVITHGTDTLEETAFFLSLVLPPAKPVVLVGAMRPATALSADGPHNLLDAVRVASARGAQNRGTLVVMNDTIFEPVSVTKVDIRRVNGFDAPLGGVVGDVLANSPRFYREAVPKGAAFDVGDAPLPKVSVAYTYAGFSEDDLRRSADGARGLIIAGVGAGGFPTRLRPVLLELLKKGVAVVRTARQGSGDVWTSLEAGAQPPQFVGIVAGRELSPAKARILLMLALQAPRSNEELQSLFTRHGLAAH